MKNRSFATLGLLALLTAGSVYGQNRLQVDIPFEFRIGSAVMPAGQYAVDTFFNSTSGLLHLRCNTSPGGALILTSRTRDNAVRTEDSLAFNKYGNTYFLSSVWISVGESSVIRRSKAERELALNHSLAPESLIVLARR